MVESLLYELQRRELEADYRHQSKHDAHDMRRLDIDRSARRSALSSFSHTCFFSSLAKVVFVNELR